MSPIINTKEIVSLKTFYRRVAKAFTLVLLIGTMILVFLIYRPMSKELERSLLKNYAHIAGMNSHTLEYIIQNGIDGARNLSSRITIKNALVDYLDGKMELQELKDYVKPLYGEMAMGLEHLECARRLVDGVEIAHYRAVDSDKCVATVIEGLEFDHDKVQKLLSTSCNIYSLVNTPVLVDGRIIAYDELIFNISERVENLNTGSIATYLMGEEEYYELIAGGNIIYEDEGTTIFKEPECLISVTNLDEGFYVATCQDQDEIWAPVEKIKRRVLVIGVSIILGFIVVIYLYLVSYARREFVSYAKEKFSLEKIAEEVNIDSLTNAGSRSCGQQYLEDRFTDFRVKKKNSALIMIDLNDFKKINDTYGHNCGDRILIEFVERVIKIIRTEDKFFRWGGDEFIGIFYNIDHNGIDRVVQKIFMAIEKEAFLHEGKKINVSISVGMSFFKRDDNSYEDVLKRADRAMYAAKKQGGNTVSILL